jgi:hypothetical protein
MAPTIYPVMLGKDNALMVTGANVSASTEDVADGFPVANLKSWRDDLPWQGTGSAEQYVQVALPNNPPGDNWDDPLPGIWNENDPNGTLATSGGKLIYNSGAFANDGAQITQDGVGIPVAGDFTIDLDIDNLTIATATNQRVELFIEFASATYESRLRIIEASGSWDVYWHVDSGGGHVLQGSHTLGGAGGRLRLIRHANGDLEAYVYDYFDSTWYQLGGTYNGGVNFASLTLNLVRIRNTLSTRSAGAFSWDSEGLYYAPLNGINSLGISAHDIASQGVTNVRLDASVGGVGWDTLVPAFTPADDRTLAKFFDPGAYLYYRLVIPTGYTHPPIIGILIIAPYLEIPSLPDTPHDPDQTEDIGQSMISSRGHYLGSVVEGTMRRQMWNFDALTHEWVDDYWEPWLRDHSRKPFIFLWAPTDRPEEAYFMWIMGKGRTTPYADTWRSLPLDLQGVYE